MGRYLETALSRDEKIIHEARISGWALVHLTVPGVAMILASGWAATSVDSWYGTLGMLGLLVGIGFIASAAVKYFSTEMAVTTRRVISKVGLVRRDTVEIPLPKVESIQVQQSILGRVFNYGTIVVAGTGSSSAPVAGIADPISFRNAYLEAEDSRMGS